MRYSKQIKLEGFGKDGQERLAQAHVAIIGAGGLGCPVITALAAAGVGTLTIIDGDTVSESNLHRQMLYNPQDIGKPKAALAAERASVLNPDIKVHGMAEHLSPENALKLLHGATLAVDCTDNFSARYLINDACVLLGLPWVFGALEGWLGQVSVLNGKDAEGMMGPTYRCLFPEPPTEEESIACDAAGLLGTVPAIIGSLQAHEAIKYISRCGEAAVGKLITMDLKGFQTYSFRVNRNHDAVARITRLQVSYQSADQCRTPSVADSIEIGLDQVLSDINRYRLIDIREAHEFEEEKIELPGIGPQFENIPYHVLLNNLNRLDHSKPIVLACESGFRSKILARRLTEKEGFTEVKSLKGGIKN